MDVDAYILTQALFAAETEAREASRRAVKGSAGTVMLICRLISTCCPHTTWIGGTCIFVIFTIYTCINILIHFKNINTAWA